eukprot:g6080.t1
MCATRSKHLKLKSRGPYYLEANLRVLTMLLWQNLAHVDLILFTQDLAEAPSNFDLLLTQDLFQGTTMLS